MNMRPTEADQNQIARRSSRNKARRAMGDKAVKGP